MRREDFHEGIAICAEFPNHEVMTLLEELGPFPLVVADPPYGNILPNDWDQVTVTDKDFARWMFDWTMKLATVTLPGAAVYIWGGIGTPGFRPFYRFCADVETKTPFTMATQVTWKKKRAYGIQWSYLFTREECAYLVLGDPKKPRMFNVPLLETKRGYAGYNAKYPAKSEFFRRTNVWDDVTELLKGKVHPAEKPTRLAEIMIETHTAPGETVLDPFAGSGSTAFAARKLGRRWVIIEKDEAIFDATVSRLRTLESQPSLL